MAEKESNQLNNLYTPILVVLLLVSTFFVGRLSAQVESNSGDSTAADTGGDVEAAETAKESPISESGLKKMAGDIKLNKKDFEKCLADGKFSQKVKDDLNYGTEVGVSGTPSFFINGLFVVGALPQAEFEKIIDAELKDGSGDKVVAESGGGEVKRTEIKNGAFYLRGSENAKVKIVEFSDFECPYCKNAQATLSALLAKYGDQISLEFRHFPLNFHPNAQRAAEASECAGEQGKFWQMHDEIFAAQ